MRKTALLALMLVVGLVCPRSSLSESITVEELQDLARHFEFFQLIERPNEPLRYVYGDVGRHLHVFVMKKNRPVLEWESTTLGSPLVDMYVADIGASGDDEIFVATAGGRVIAFDGVTYELKGENYLDPFEVISCMTVYNLDDDPQLEIILIADGRLRIYDGKSIALEWVSQQKFSATEMVVANVDDDEQVEIILNTGPVIDSRFYTIEIEDARIGKGGYGTRLKLQDLNGDGFPEIIGETPGFSLRIYDIYAQREIW